MLTLVVSCQLADSKNSNTLHEPKCRQPHYNLVTFYLKLSHMSHPLPPITALTSSEEEAVKPPPTKKRRSDSSGRSTAFPNPHGSDVRKLLNQVCQCSKKRKKAKEACFLKFKDQLEDLENMRHLFRSLHKLDQDQLASWFLYIPSPTVSYGYVFRKSGGWAHRNRFMLP